MRAADRRASLQVRGLPRGMEGLLMSPIRNALALGAALAALLVASRAPAATATSTVTGQNSNMTGAGFATAEKSTASGFGQANGYEFRGGVGVSAFGGTGGTVSTQVNARATAGISDSFRVTGASGLSNLGGTVFGLTVPILVSGEATSSHSVFPANPQFTSLASAHYGYAWNVGGFSGAGEVFNSKNTRGVAFQSDSTQPAQEVLLLVRLGEVVSLSFGAFAEVGLLGLPNAPASATADFGHTLRWGGVTDISAMDASGAPIDLPADFTLSLVSGGSGFDYWNAAGQNPFTSAAVPEPATWATMILGFFGLGSMIRSRRTLSARTAA